MNLQTFATNLRTERKRQNLTRAQMAAVANVSTSFIRDAERDSGSCTLDKLQRLVESMGLKFEITGWTQKSKEKTS